MWYLSHKWPRLCSVCRNHNLTLSLLVTYQWVCNKSNTTGTTGEIGTAYPSGRHEFIPGFCSICRFVHIVCTSLCVLLSFVFCSLYYQFFFCWRFMITTLVSSSISSNVICRGFCLRSLFVLLKLFKVLTIMLKLFFYCIVLFLILIPRIFCP